MAFSLLTCSAVAGEYRMGGFEFELPGTWHVQRSQSELAAVRDKGTFMPLVKIEFCGPDEKMLKCDSAYIERPEGTDYRNFPCASTKQNEIHHTNGLREIQKGLLIRECWR